MHGETVKFSKSLSLHVVISRAIQRLHYMTDHCIFSTVVFFQHHFMWYWYACAN